MPPLSTSLSGETEDVDDDVVVLEWVLFAEVAVVLGVPEAGGTHVKSAVALLENNHVRCELQIFVNFLQQLDDHLRGIITPFLCLFWVVCPHLERFKN